MYSIRHNYQQRNRSYSHTRRRRDDLDRYYQQPRNPWNDTSNNSYRYSQQPMNPWNDTSNNSYSYYQQPRNPWNEISNNSYRYFQQPRNPWNETSNNSYQQSKRERRPKRKREEDKNDLADTATSSLNPQNLLALNSGEIRCVICLDTEHLQERKCIPCGHTFHTQCLNRWLENKNHCPLCRCFVDVGRPQIKRRNLYGTRNNNFLYPSSSSRQNPEHYVDQFGYNRNVSPYNYWLNQNNFITYW